MDKGQACWIAEIQFIKHENKMFVLSRLINIEVNLTAFESNVSKRFANCKSSSG